jgi:RND family efflux transporter MFP subunit
MNRYSPDVTLESPSTKTRPRLFGKAVVVVVVIAVAFTAGLIPRLRGQQAVRETTRELAVPTVTVVSPQPGKPGSTLALPAEIRPLTEASLYARATGYVRKWHAELGASVTNGQVLAELDTPDLDQELAQARSSVREAEAAETLAKTTADRWQEMFKVAAISRQETDEKLAEYQLRLAQLESARANVRRLEELTGFSKIVAPFDGIVTSRRLDLGQLVSAGAGNELYRLARTEMLRVFVRIPQNLAPQVKPGQTAEVRFNEHPAEVFHAKIVRTARALDPSSRTLLTELELPNPDLGLLPGGYAQIRLPDLKADPVPTIPANTLLFRAEGTQVAAVDDGGKVRLKKVELGRDFGPVMEVINGVAATDKLVLNPSDALADGATVHPVEQVASKSH